MMAAQHIKNHIKPSNWKRRKNPKLSRGIIKWFEVLDLDVYQCKWVLLHGLYLEEMSRDKNYKWQTGNLTYICLCLLARMCVFYNNYLILQKLQLLFFWKGLKKKITSNEIILVRIFFWVYSYFWSSVKRKKIIYFTITGNTWITSFFVYFCTTFIIRILLLFSIVIIYL